MTSLCTTVNPYCSLLNHEASSSDPQIFFRILVKLVECAIESLGHGLQRIFYSSSYGDLKLTFCMDVQTTWKPKEFLMFPYVSLPKAAKIHMPSFLKNYAPKLSQNLLQCFRTVWEHPQFNWELIRHIFLVITCSSKWRLVFQPFASSRGRHWLWRELFSKSEHILCILSPTNNISFLKG